MQYILSIFINVMTISDTCRIWLCMTSACMHVKFVMSLLCNYLSLSPICYIYPSSVIVSFLSSTDHTLLASQSYFCLLQIEFPLFLIFISPSSLLCWKLSLLFHSISLSIVFCFWFDHFVNTYSVLSFLLFMSQSCHYCTIIIPSTLSCQILFNYGQWKTHRKTNILLTVPTHL